MRRTGKRSGGGRRRELESGEEKLFRGGLPYCHIAAGQRGQMKGGEEGEERGGKCRIRKGGRGEGCGRHMYCKPV